MNSENTLAWCSCPHFQVKMAKVVATCRGVIIERFVIAVTFGGRYKDHITVMRRKVGPTMARNAATVWAVARGDTDEDIFQAHDGRT